MKRLLPKSEYARNSVISVMGVVVASVIPFLLQPVLGRLYTPEDARILGLFFTTATVLSVIANFRYAQAVATTSTDNEAKNLLAATLYLSFFFSLFVAVIILIFSGQISAYFEIPVNERYWLYLIPFSTFFISVCIGFNGWLNRYKKYKSMAINKSVRRGGEGIAQVVLGKLKISGGLVWGNMIGDAINFVVHYVQFRRAGGDLKNLNRNDIKKDLKTYSDFPKFNLIPTLMDTLSMSLPFMIVDHAYSENTSGQFYQSTYILALPLALISVAISQVLLQKLTENRTLNKPVSEILYRHILFLAALALIGSAVLYFFGEEIFVVFLGDQWGAAGEMASWMVLGYAAKFVVSPLSVIFFSHQKVGQVSYWQFFRFCAVASLYWFSHLSIFEFIVIYVLCETVLYAIYLIMIIKLARDYDRSIKY